jgi:hypothetical protein
VNVRALLTRSLLAAIAAVSWLAPAPASAKDAGKSSTGKFDVSSDPAAVAKPKTYKFKATKKGALGGAQVMTLLVADPFDGRTET